MNYSTELLLVAATRYTVCIHLCCGLTLGFIRGVGPRYNSISEAAYKCATLTGSMKSATKCCGCKSGIIVCTDAEEKHSSKQV